MTDRGTTATRRGGPPAIWEVASAALRLGLTSFGGPIAHLRYFHHEYLGALIAAPPFRALGASLALLAIFLPSFLLIWGTLPFWHQLRGGETFRRALLGTNAAVVGILVAALYQPIWITAVTSFGHAAVALVVFGLLAALRIPPWAAVLISVAAGEALSRVQYMTPLGS